MGAWGTSLYSNDTTSDIRGDFLDKLRRGKTTEEATEELIATNQEIMGDREEESLFWLALADTQWDYGRLLPMVKEKALYFLSHDSESERWRESGERQLLAWQKTLRDLEQKLLSPQPHKKKISQYRFYRCEWKCGDVFAYRFIGEYSKTMGYYGQYVVFIKVAESMLWPGHIIPVVRVYKWVGRNIPTMKEIRNIDFLVPKINPDYVLRQIKNNPNYRIPYEIELMNSSKRVIPKENLYYLGNVSKDNILSTNYSKATIGVCWEGQKYNLKFEKWIIDSYLAWKDIDVELDY